MRHHAADRLAFGKKSPSSCLKARTGVTLDGGSSRILGSGRFPKLCAPAAPRRTAGLWAPSSGSVSRDPTLRERHLTTPAQVLSARRQYAAGGVTQSALARRYGVSHSAMGYLLRGESYRDVGGPVGTRGQPATKWNVTEARRLRAKGWTYDELGNRYGVSHVRVWQVLNR